MQNIEVTHLTIYPIKSLAGINIEHAVLTPKGLHFKNIADRQWMITDNNYRFLSQRELPLMSQIKLQITSQGLQLKKDNDFYYISIEKEHCNQKQVNAKVWHDDCLATDEGDEVSDWLTKVLGKWHNKPLRLVIMEKDFKRRVEQNAIMPQEQTEVNFADAFPYLLANQSSLTDINEQFGQTIMMNQYRPNIVIKNLPAWQEDELKTIEHQKGTYTFAMAKFCQRCKIISINQQTGVVSKDNQPYEFMRGQLTKKGVKLNSAKIYFGQNLLLTHGQSVVINLGDTLSITY